MKPSPPHWPLRFLRWFCREDFIDEIEGDLTEIYLLHYEKSPAKAAKTIYLGCYQTFSA